MYSGINGAKPKQLQRTDKAPPSTVCQKCMQKGHYTYQCKNSRPYQPRPSRTQQLEKGLGVGDKKRKGDGPMVELPDEFRTKKGLADKILAEREAQRKLEEEKKQSKRSRRRSSSSSSSSDSESDSNSESDSDSQSDSSSHRKRSYRDKPRQRSVSPFDHARAKRPEVRDRSQSPVRKPRSD